MAETPIPRIVVVGSVNMDLVVEIGEVPEQGQTRTGKSFKLLPGGKGANQAVAAARLHSQTIFIGAVGSDRFGEQLLSAMQTENIHCSVTVMPEESTGVASIWVYDTDNRIVVVPGANGKLAWQDIHRSRHLIDGADVVLLQLEISPAAVQETIRYAYESGKKVVLNPAPAHKLPEELYPMLYAMTPNRDELAVLAESPELLGGFKPGLLDEAMDKLLSKGLNAVVVTLGSEGAAYKDARGLRFHVPGKKVQALDTTGAGDCFNAAFSVSIARGDGAKKAVEFAVAASALAVTRFGAQNGMPQEEEIVRFMEEMRV
ncbi:ribokinase [Cohnella hongkongensis]|uniref:Ribokinase n=1 Tax=Cohnella hongkongensis TaxID=178337 RepID=A0ABV9F6S4_9BACL